MQTVFEQGSPSHKAYTAQGPFDKDADLSFTGCAPKRISHHNKTPITETTQRTRKRTSSLKILLWLCYLQPFLAPLCYAAADQTLYLGFHGWSRDDALHALPADTCQRPTCLVAPATPLKLTTQPYCRPPSHDLSQLSNYADPQTITANNVSHLMWTTFDTGSVFNRSKIEPGFHTD